MQVEKIAIFISGNGSNMKAIIEACQGGDLEGWYEVVCVISNNKDAGGLEIAASKNIETYIFIGGLREFEDRSRDILDGLQVDLICLAGFMKILSKSFVDRYEILNIHPSLLPKYKGLNPQKQALESGDKLSGCTVHRVSSEVDSGEILRQECVGILEGDTVGRLSERILQQEHICYVLTLLERKERKHGQQI